jgi:hypothetical protein
VFIVQSEIINPRIPTKTGMTMCHSLSPVTSDWRELKNETTVAKTHGGAVSSNVTVVDLNPKVAAKARKQNGGA